MMSQQKNRIIGAVSAISLAILMGLASNFDPAGEIAQAQAQAQVKPATTDAAIERTRNQVKMLDDLYKTAVVLITEHYVNSPTTVSGATAAKAIFAAMKKNNWHEARLVGFTDVLYSQDNAPRDEFEKSAQTKLLAGETWAEEVMTKDGKRFLRVATVVPVVMEKCVMCHANFKDKKGAIGALTYVVPMVE